MHGDDEIEFSESFSISMFCLFDIPALNIVRNSNKKVLLSWQL